MLPIEKYNNIVKMKWSACRKRVTKKNLSPFQDSNLWSPKHRAGALPTWSTENSFYNIIASFVPDKRQFH